MTDFNQTPDNNAQTPQNPVYSDPGATPVVPLTPPEPTRAPRKPSQGPSVSTSPADPVSVSASKPAHTKGNSKYARPAALNPTSVTSAPVNPTPVAPTSAAQTVTPVPAPQQAGPAPRPVDPASYSGAAVNPGSSYSAPAGEEYVTKQNRYAGRVAPPVDKRKFLPFQWVSFAFAIVTLILAIILVLTKAYLVMAVALLQTALFLVGWLWGGVIKVNRRGFSKLFTIAGFVLFMAIPFATVGQEKVETYAKENQKLDWPKTGLATQLPHPTSKYGTIDDYGFMLSVEIYQVGIHDYDNYLANLKAMGYIYAVEDEDDRYCAYNADGYQVKLYNYEYLEEMDIILYDTDGYSLVDWPTTGLGALLPEPSLPFGAIVKDEADFYEAYAVLADAGGIEDYITYCQDAGYTSMLETDYDDFIGIDAEGNILMVTDASDYYVAKVIMIGADYDWDYDETQDAWMADASFDELVEAYKTEADQADLNDDLMTMALTVKRYYSYLSQMDLTGLSDSELTDYESDMSIISSDFSYLIGRYE